MEEKTTKTKAKVNPLRNEKIFVKYVPNVVSKETAEKGHVCEGGLMDGCIIKLTVPMLRSGHYKNVLTNSEKEFLEEFMKMDYNALSVYNTNDNYWDDYYITLDKNGLHLDLSDPDDYIKYAVLKANTEMVAPSMDELEARPKATYRFVLINEGDESRLENAKMDATMASYKEFGKIENDLDTLRILIEFLDGRPYAANTPPQFLRARANALIQSNAKTFLRQITDPYLHAKVLLRRGVELGKVSMRGDYYYLASDSSPLCDLGKNPTLAIAAAYLNDPAHQDIKFVLEEAVEKNKAIVK